MNPFVMSACAPPFLPNSSMKVTKVAKRVFSENPEDNEEPWLPMQKISRQPDKQVQIKTYADLAELELQIQCVHMVANLVD